MLGALHVLALNSGSSSLKFGLYRVSASQTETLFAKTLAVEAEADIVRRIAGVLAEAGMPPPDAVGHRIVHGGPKLRHHCLIDEEVLAALEAATAFAPLHTPTALAVIRGARAYFPDLPQVACFDTAFHIDLPEIASTLPLPAELRAQGVRRYGFHGLSCESILQQLGDAPPERLIIAHLGAGASVTAVRAGRSIDTSMGLTPTGGVIMGTRSGDLDPGVLVYLMRALGFDAAAMEDLVDHRSGLRGVSGIAGDMRQLHDAAAGSAEARLAIHMFCYSVRKQAAAMIAALDGADTLVFTGGIGENDAAVRAEICDGLSWIGVGLDHVRNGAAENPISHPASRVQVMVLPSLEDEQIARHARTLVETHDFG
jgi:acetate kinase